MSPRTTHRWLTWLLPLLVLRAFVPAGFMLSWSSGHLQIMLCSGAGPVPAVQQAAASIDPAAQTHHAQALQQAGQGPLQHDHGERPEAHDNSLCPFAAAGTSAVPVPHYASVVVLPPGLDSPEFAAVAALGSAPIFLDRIRGPPLA